MILPIRHSNKLARPAAEAERPRRFLQLLSAFRRGVDQGTQCGIYAFTSAVPGEGVTHVTGEIGEEIAIGAEERVLITAVPALYALRPRDLEDPNSNLVRRVKPNLYVAPAAPMKTAQSTPGQAIAPASIPQDMIDALRRKFTYVLIDARALRVSAEILRISSQVDGIVLVVGAGHSTREQVQHARKIIQLATDNLLGCVFNKQMEAVPSIFDRYTSESGDLG